VAAQTSADAATPVEAANATRLSVNKDFKDCGS
jgi:hypothetical protein